MHEYVKLGACASTYHGYLGVNGLPLVNGSHARDNIWLAWATVTLIEECSAFTIFQ